MANKRFYYNTITNQNLRWGIMSKEMIVCNYIYIPVSDLKQAANWYEEILDFKVVFQDNLYYELRTVNGIRVMLIPNELHINSQMIFPSGQQPAYGFIVMDINKFRENLNGRNVKVGEIFDYCGKSFSFYDLDNNKIEIWEEIKE